MDGRMKDIVVLGAGHWVKGQYARALQPYRRREECGVFFVYNTSYAEAAGLRPDDAQRYNRYTLQNVKEFEAWGATCLNVAEPEAREILKGISPYAVFVVTPDDTHCEMVEEWLDRALNIIVEKPFDVDHERIRRLRRTLKDSPVLSNVWGFDHYLVRANQFVKMKGYLGFDEHLEGQIHEFRFHMLEAGEGGLPQRSASLQSGLIMDMGSHTPALILPFGNPNTISLDYVKAGVYGPGGEVRTSGRELIVSGMETFAKIRFNFTSVFGDAVRATACVGKCVGDQDEKFVEVIGGRNRDRIVRLDLSSFIVDFFGGENPGPTTSLFSDPVHLLVREVLAERHPTSLALFDPLAGQNIMARLNEWRRPIIRHLQDGKQLGEYAAGSSLDHIISNLESL